MATQFMCANCKSIEGTLAPCEVCLSEYYCSEDCRLAHWPEHERNCLNIANYNEAGAHLQHAPQDVEQGKRVLEVLRDSVSMCDPLTGNRLMVMQKCHPADLIQITADWTQTKDIDLDKCRPLLSSVVAQFFQPSDTFGVIGGDKQHSQDGLEVTILPKTEAVARRYCSQSEVDQQFMIMFVATLRIDQNCSFSIAFGA